MKALDIEVALYTHFNPRINIVVPNVSWGMGINYECDMVVLRPSGFATEIEIKVSRADIKADLKKRHIHDAKKSLPGWQSAPLFREFYFAVPEALKDDPCIPESAGILVVSEYGYKPVAPGCRRPTTTVYRKALIRTGAVKWDDKMRLKLYRLGMMRIQALKQKLRQAERGIEKPKPVKLNRSRETILLERGF